MQFKICKKCPIPHIENCGTCVGFGIHFDDRIIPGYDACMGLVTQSKACPECGSTHLGASPVQVNHEAK